MIFVRLFVRMDCFCLMPIGGGKSLYYELPAFIKPGLVLVVSLLIGKPDITKSTAIVTNFLLGHSFVHSCAFPTKAFGICSRCAFTKAKCSVHCIL
jgi:hypothetical protein